MKYSERMKIASTVVEVTAFYSSVNKQVTLFVQQTGRATCSLTSAPIEPSAGYWSEWRLAEVICDFEDWIHWAEPRLDDPDLEILVRIAARATLNRL